MPVFLDCCWGIRIEFSFFFLTLSQSPNSWNIYPVLKPVWSSLSELSEFKKQIWLSKPIFYLSHLLVLFQIETSLIYYCIQLGHLHTQSNFQAKFPSINQIENSSYSFHSLLNEKFIFLSSDSRWSLCACRMINNSTLKERGKVPPPGENRWNRCGGYHRQIDLTIPWT